MRVRVKNIAHDQIYSESKHSEITIGKEYNVLGIEYDDYRIMNDDNEPILYEPYIFDGSIPESWIKVDCGDGDYSMYPPEFLDPPYFFEMYFDRDSNVIKAFNDYLKKVKI